MHLMLTSPVQSGGRFFRKSSVRVYRFGFNGKEKVDEVYGDANAYDFGARLYDPRLGRWLAVDPLSALYVDLCPYTFAGNSPVIFWDNDGEKFVNPYQKDYEKAKADVVTSTEIYNEMVKNGVKKSEARESSGLTSNQRALSAIEPKYQEVQDYLYTLEKTNKKEYDYFNNLKNKKTNEEIDIYISLEDENPNGSKVGTVEGLQIYSDYTPTAKNNKLEVILYTRGKGKTITMDYESGRNYRTFTNELGDIKFFFDTVKDEATFNFQQSTATEGTPGYEDPNGAGKKSFEYEDKRVGDVKTYVKAGMDSSESFNPVKNTIEKR